MDEGRRAAGAAAGMEEEGRGGKARRRREGRRGEGEKGRRGEGEKRGSTTHACCLLPLPSVFVVMCVFVK